MAYLGYVDGRSLSAAFVRWGARARFRPTVRRGIRDMSFLPDGRLVVLQRRDRGAWILMVGRRGVQRRFRIRGNPHYRIKVTRAGLIGYEGGTGILRVLVEKAGDRIATLAPDGDMEVIGHYDGRYHVYDFEWEPR